MPKDTHETAINNISQLIGLDNSPSTRLLATSVPDLLVRIQQVRAVTGLSTASIYREMAERRFPSPVRITRHAVAWRLSELMTWIETRQRGGEGAVEQIAVA